ncbi:hypothetical protein FJT64_010444 [Amphibalanus amphitrite]|uniref:Uncharacterized protein n=1 Tax=Amphibalanus amphitrite TaxID=1232801 RepID=A0A6A4VA36_AMPAM|nr:hypothetical protein FJT64_010444 [Amphibalanus amphitrite]
MKSAPLLLAAVACCVGIASPLPAAPTIGPMTNDASPASVPAPSDPPAPSGGTSGPAVPLAVPRPVRRSAPAAGPPLEPLAGPYLGAGGVPLSSAPYQAQPSWPQQPQNDLQYLGQPPAQYMGQPAQYLGQPGPSLVSSTWTQPGVQYLGQPGTQYLDEAGAPYAGQAGQVNPLPAGGSQYVEQDTDGSDLVNFLLQYPDLLDSSRYEPQYGESAEYADYPSGGDAWQSVDKRPAPAAEERTAPVTEDTLLQANRRSAGAAAGRAGCVLHLCPIHYHHHHHHYHHHHPSDHDAEQPSGGRPRPAILQLAPQRRSAGSGAEQPSTESAYDTIKRFLVMEDAVEKGELGCGSRGAGCFRWRTLCPANCCLQITPAAANMPATR